MEVIVKAQDMVAMVLLPCGVVVDQGVSDGVHACNGGCVQGVDTVMVRNVRRGSGRGGGEARDGQT